MVEEKIAEPIVNRFAVIQFVCLWLMSGSTHNHVSAHVNETSEKFGLSRNWRIASGIFLAVIRIAIALGVLDVYDDVVPFGFSFGDLLTSERFVIDIGAWGSSSSTLSVSLG